MNDPVRLSHLKLRLSDALIKARQPVEAYEQVKVALNLIENQDNVPDWLKYSAKSLHGATLIELGRCAKGMRLLDNSVDEMFLDRVTDPRIASKIHARKESLSNREVRGLTVCVCRSLFLDVASIEKATQ